MFHYLDAAAHVHRPATGGKIAGAVKVSDPLSANWPSWFWKYARKNEPD